MFNYEHDYEEYYEPSEIDEALEEVKNGLRKYLNKDISDRLEDQASTIEHLRKQVKKQQEHISKLRLDVRQAVKDGKEEEVSRIAGDIRKGDTAYIIQYVRKEKDCPVCEDGFLYGKNDSKTKCPECRGTGKKSYNQHEVVEKTVSKVEIKVEDGNYGLILGRRWYYVNGVEDWVKVYRNKEDAEKDLKAGKTNKWQ